MGISDCIGRKSFKTQDAEQRRNDDEVLSSLQPQVESTLGLWLTAGVALSLLQRVDASRRYWVLETAPPSSHADGKKLCLGRRSSAVTGGRKKDTALNPLPSTHRRHPKSPTARA